MFEVVKPLGDLVTTLPAGPEYPGRTAGPSFELFYESDYVLPHREAAWILLTERIREAAAFCEPGAPCGPAVAGGLRRGPVRPERDRRRPRRPPAGPLRPRKPRLRPRTSAPCWPAPKILPNGPGRSPPRRPRALRPGRPARLRLPGRARAPGRRPHGRPPRQQRPAPPSRRPAPALRNPNSPPDPKHPSQPQRAPTVPLGPGRRRHHPARPPRRQRAARPARGGRRAAGPGRPPGSPAGRADVQPDRRARPAPARPAARDHDRAGTAPTWSPTSPRCARRSASSSRCRPSWPCAGAAPRR